MNFYRPILLTSFLILLVVISSECSPQRNLRTNRRLGKQELDAADNEVTSTVQPNVYSNNNPGYGGYGGYGNGFPSGFAFLPPPLMMMMMMRNGMMGRAFFSQGGIDMNSVQRVLQAVMKVLQEIEQEKQAGGGNPVAAVPSAAQIRY